MLSSDQHLQSWVKSIEKCKVFFLQFYTLADLLRKSKAGYELGQVSMVKTGLTGLRWGPPGLGDASGLGYNQSCQ